MPGGAGFGYRPLRRLAEAVAAFGADGERHRLHRGLALSQRGIGYVRLFRQLDGRRRELGGRGRALGRRGEGIVCRRLGADRLADAGDDLIERAGNMVKRNVGWR